MIRKKTTAELVAERPNPDNFKNLERFPIYVILDNVRSLQNVGLVFRLCDALRVKKLFLTGFTGYPPAGENDPRLSNIQEHAYNQITKTAIKLVPFVDWEYRSDIHSVLDQLKADGVQLVALEQTHGATTYTDVKYHFPVAFIIGHEREGINDAVLDKCDIIAEIPMYGIGNSLNLATALAVAAYETIKRLEE